MEPMGAKGDKPRKIVVCHPSEVAELQRTIVGAGFTDVLVKPTRLCEPGEGYIIDGSVLDPPSFVDFSM